jgi:hypothetical protein
MEGGAVLVRVGVGVVVKVGIVVEVKIIFVAGKVGDSVRLGARVTSLACVGLAVAVV